MADQEQMTGAQLAAVERYKHTLMLESHRNIELRKIALDKACMLAERSTSGFTPESFMEFAEAMHKFLTADAPD